MRVADIDQELEQARAQGPVRDIVIPPCPELLTELQGAMRQGDPGSGRDRPHRRRRRGRGGGADTAGQ